MKRGKARGYEKPSDDDAQGISNRESPQAEAEERKSHPPIQESPERQETAEGQDAAAEGDQPEANASRDEQTSSKAGSRSTALKEAGTRYANRSMPATRKVAGAFGREQGGDDTTSESQPPERESSPK